MPADAHGLTSSVHDVDEEGRRQSSHSMPHLPFFDKEELASLTHVLQQNRKKLPPTSFAMAPPVPLPLWQRVALSTIKRVEYEEDDQRQSATAQTKLGKELAKYHAEVHAREERTRRQQREARAQLGGRLAVAVRRFWTRRGDAFQQMQRVEFDVLQRHRDKRKQEDLLKETEDLTRKLLDSILSGKPKDSPAAGDEARDEDGARADKAETGALATVEQTFRQSGNDGTVEIEASLALLDTENGKRPLRHYQRSALHWMIHLFENKLNGILADEMGLGKTVQTIALLCYYAQYKNDWGPHLIVVPTTVVLNWKAELQRWAPGLKVLTYLGSGKERAKLRHGWTAEDAFHVCVTSYNLVVQDRRVFRQKAWGFLVLDEAHQVKNFMSKKWQSLFDLQAEYRLLLTGTPLQNSIMELWSLFHFLLPFASAFRSNDEFKEWFSNPMDDMITGRSSLNEDIVRRLQALIRPFMLRRLKSDVEAQLPTKTEKVVLCRLSRRQRSLYDDYMQLADTKQRLRGGGAGGVLSVLLGLRKVCDHPDLFEERPTVSPLALDRFAAITLPVPRLALLRHNEYRGRYRFPSFPGLEVVDVNIDNEEDGRGPGCRRYDVSDCFAWFPCALTQVRWHADVGTSGCGAVSLFPACLPSGAERDDSWAARFAPSHMPQPPGLSTLGNVLAATTQELGGLCAAAASAGGLSRNAGFLSAFRLLLAAGTQGRQRIEEGYDHVTSIQRQRQREEYCSVRLALPRAVCLWPLLKDTRIKWHHGGLCPTVAERAAAVLPVVQKVAVYVPAALAVFPPTLHWARPVRRASGFQPLSREACACVMGFAAKSAEAMRGDRQWRRDLFDGSTFLAESWPVQVRRCFSFPDKRLIIHDCGKLQFLATTLRQLRQEGHRMLIFTQFVNMLNILERFLALIGVAYLRLDGSTRAEARQAMVDRFNEDTRVTCMILSTRSGGIGLNLTGADTVIFYDSDWNPTMDLQAQDRCHRIGQTRPVTIYRLISEHTVEEAILEKARERKKLNNVVIRGGQFHAIAGVGEQYDDTAAAFAALSDPVNLRSFFHDFDEDVALPAATAGPASASTREDILAEMGKVEDDEDRAARTQVEAEMEQRATADAAEQGEEDGDEAGGVGGAINEPAVWPRRGAPQGGDAASSAAGAVTRPALLATQVARLEHALSPQDEGSVPMGHPELVEAKLIPVVRKRQREVLAKAKTPLDRLLAGRYGVCHEDDAWVRYNKLCDDYEAKLVDEDHVDDVDSVFPAFRTKLEL